jgi:hypothetical protein
MKTQTSFFKEYNRIKEHLRLYISVLGLDTHKLDLQNEIRLIDQHLYLCKRFKNNAHFESASYMFDHIYSRLYKLLTTFEKVYKIAYATTTHTFLWKDGNEKTIIRTPYVKYRTGEDLNG